MGFELRQSDFRCEGLKHKVLLPFQDSSKEKTLAKLYFLLGPVSLSRGTVCEWSDICAVGSLRGLFYTHL